MIIDRSQAKLAARNCMRTAQISPYQIGLVYVLIAFAASIFDSLMMSLFATTYYIDSYTTVIMPSPINWFVTILVSLIMVILQAGIATYALGVRRGKQMPLSTLFDGFSIVGKVVLLTVVTSIFISLWTMLFIIPGIIAAYRYRFSLYNLLENPDMGVMEAINLSKQQTEGFKWQLFVLDLSFLGWLIVSVFTMGFLGIWLIPYMLLTDVAFYDAICEYKGMRVSAQSTEPVFSNPSAQTQNNTYDQTQQHGSQNESGEPAVENPAESTDDTNAEISGNFEVDSLFDQSAPKAPDVPQQTNNISLEKKNDSDSSEQNN